MESVHSIRSCVSVLRIDTVETDRILLVYLPSHIILQCVTYFKGFFLV